MFKFIAIILTETPCNFQPKHDKTERMLDLKPDFEHFIHYF